MATMQRNYEGDGLKVLEHIFAGGEVLATQQPMPSNWSSEKRLAGAVFASGLLARDQRWMASGDTEWPYSFLRLCELFGLEPSWVRRIARSWEATGRGTNPSRRDGYRHAA